MNVTYNENAYLKERTLIYVSGILSGNRVKLTEVDGEVLSSPVVYTPDINGNLTIDITDIVRIYGINNYIELHIGEIDSDGEIVGRVVDVEITAVGDTNPELWVRPLHPAEQYWNAIERTPLPTRILKPLADTSVIFPTYGHLESAGIHSHLEVIDEQGEPRGIETDDVTLTDSDVSARILMYEPRGYRARWWQMLEPLKCGHNYAIVEWIDRYGCTKRAVWEMRNVAENTINTIAIDNIENAYDIRKGKEVTATLHLDTLISYDVWYYADIAQSSKVLVSVDGNKWMQVEVTTDKVSIPNSDDGKMHSLDIDIKLKRYDTI